jgi:SAM-dependent methyltransferase
MLDVGCGAGRDTGLLADAGCSVVGADAAGADLALARRRVAPASRSRRIDDIGCTGRVGYGVWWVRAQREMR